MTSTSRIRRWWTEEEDQVLRREAEFQLSRGSLNDWNRIAAKLPGRTNKDCRKRWSKIPGHINKGVWSSAEDQRLKSAVKTFGYRWTHVAQSVGTRNGDQCAKRWHHSLDPSLDHSEWIPEDDARLLAAVASCGRVWKTIGEKEFPGRSATELKNRFIILDRKRQQLVAASSALQTPPKEGIKPAATTYAEVDMEDSESTTSLTDDDGADPQEADFNSDILSHAAASRTTPGSDFPSLTASSLTTPGSYVPAHNGPPHIMSENFSFTEHEFTTNLHTLQGGDDFFSSSSSPGTFFNQNDISLPSDNPTLDLTAPWSITPFPSPTQPGDDTMAGIDMGKERHGSTLILEDVQPQMVTSIINMLFQSESVVKMKIVSQE